MQRRRLSRIALGAALLCASGFAACTSQQSAREPAAAATAPPASAESAEVVSPAAVPAGAPEDRGEPAAEAKPATPPAPSEPGAEPPEAPETPSSAAAVPAPGVSGETSAGNSVPPVDLDQLTQHLKDTSAIGLFTKLELKSQIDELVEKARSSHERGVPPLERLHERFDLLVLKLLSLLQDDAPALAAEVAASRDSLWALLADPVQLSRL